ncbi:ROK family transcriptional regulator [Paenibacillus radicis (ex Xue et al. 2023)]|uniref:ROK family transcriptional regulator n=1 Tax=Paenibacillus radicis (ex Xue et al. 2023) TaxID=2972489 RepID=A0ABT1YLZ1_9BACL|nr:ROK family transcriptional regulator [Paenibacillus radicis (ex Xue et al. 2023)]MCR8634196.1 ROK family transcriptional regulator [Paenibacillus radicis (ex Xue et al. 2023)]
MIKREMTGDADLIKQINIMLVMNLIREKGPISRIEISKISKLNKATVSSMVEELIAKRYVVEIGEVKSKRGRRPTLLNFNGDAGYVIGIELNVGFMTVIVVNLNAGVHWKKSYLISDNEKEIVDQLFKAIDEARSAVPQSALGIIGIGIGVVGIVNHETGTLVIAPNAGLQNLPLKHLVESYTGIQTFVDNDCNTSVIGESTFGAGKGRNHQILLSVTNRGIGVGIFIDGKVFRGQDGFAGEMGHMTINMEGPRCNCGNRGCWEMYSSPQALIRNFMKNKNIETPPKVDEIIALANAGDNGAITALTETGEFLGIGLANVVNTFNPEVIIIRGDMAKADKWILNPIHRTLSERCYFYASTRIDIVPSRFGELAASIGAACEVIHYWFYSYEQKL